MITGTVSTISIVMMGVAAICSIAIPLLILLYLKKKGADVPPFLIGCLVMLVFALILESIVHNIFLPTPVGKTVQNNILMFAIYGGLMAGLFEETGRLVAFKTVMKQFRDKDINALMYGAGHGGFEAMAILGITMISNIVMSIMINSGTIGTVTSALPAESVDVFIEQIQPLTTIAPAAFLLGIVERILAITIHMALSVLVWFGVKNNKLRMYVLSMLIHAVFDAVTVLIAKSGIAGAEYITEVVIAIMVVITVFFAKKIWEKESVEVQTAA